MRGFAFRTGRVAARNPMRLARTPRVHRRLRAQRVRSATQDRELSPGGFKSIGGNREYRASVASASSPFLLLLTSPPNLAGPTSPKAWQIMHEELTKAGVRSVGTADVDSLRRAGAVFIDVRPSNDFEKGHIEGSISVPLFQPITGWDGNKLARRAAYAFFGIANGTEANENFEAEVMAAADKGDRIVMVCATGGTLESSTNFKRGKQSRSLMAAYEMLLLGFKDIKFVDGGINQWYMEEREVFVLSD